MPQANPDVYTKQFVYELHYHLIEIAMAKTFKLDFHT